MLQRSLARHFKNITPTEILFCPQNLHQSSSQSQMPSLGLFILPTVTEQSPTTWRHRNQLAWLLDSRPRDSDTLRLSVGVVQG